MVKTVLPTQEDMSSIPDSGTKIPHAKWYGQKQFLSKKKINGVYNSMVFKKNKTAYPVD